MAKWVAPLLVISFLVNINVFLYLWMINFFTFNEQDNDRKNKMNVTQTTANELYTYCNYVIYHVGYIVKGNAEEVVAYVKEYILHNNLQEVGLEHNVMGIRSMQGEERVC